MTSALLLILLIITYTHVDASASSSSASSSMSSAHIQRLQHLRHRYHTVHVTSTHTSTSTSTSHPHTLQLHININQQHMELPSFIHTLVLHKNTHLVAERYQHIYLYGDISTSTSTSLHDCFYDGYVLSHDTSRVAMTTCYHHSDMSRDLSLMGMIHLNDTIWMIETSSHRERMMAKGHIMSHDMTSHTYDTHTSSDDIHDHIIYRLNDIESLGSCGHDDDIQAHLAHSHQHPHQHQVHTLISTLQSQLQQHSFHIYDTSTKYVELLIVNDVKRYSTYGSTTEIASARLIHMVNSLYSSLSPSINIILIGQITFITSDPYNITETTCSGCSLGQINSAELLATFNTWKKKAKEIPIHDTAHLFTGRTLEQGIVGKATVNGMCDVTSNAGVEQITFMDGFNAVIAAHEIGHNLGMIHDGEGICASIPTSTYGIMRPAIVDSRCGANAPQGSCQATPASTWSQCSTTSYQSFLKSTTATCLSNEPTKLWADTQICGNGFIEGNETCDCGARDCTHDPCCNGQTCQLRPNAKCSATDACCDMNCRIVPKNASLPCRAATSDCDLVETCDGTSSACPADLVRGAGTPCTMFASSEAGLCYLGSCIAPTTQCELITYQISTNNQYHPCQRERQLELTAGQICGTLYCARINGPDNICYKFSSGNSTNFKVNDGTPCGESVTEALQCSKGECVASVNINPFKWNVSDWSPCACASQTQTRNVSCMSLTYEQVPSGACTGSQPITSQYCDCNPSTSVATWKIIIYFISGIGAILLIYLIIRIIYKYRPRRITQDPSIKPTQQQEFSITHDLVNGTLHDKKQRPHSAIPSANSVRRESQISQEKGIKSHRDKNKRIHAPTTTETTLAPSLMPMSLHPFTSKEEEEKVMNKKQDDIGLDVQVSISPAPMMNPNQRQQAIRPSAPMVTRAASPPPAPSTSESLATAIYSGAIALQSTPGTSSFKHKKTKSTSTWQRNPDVPSEDNELTPVTTKQPIQRHPQSMRMQATSTSSPGTSANNSPARRMRTKRHGVMSDSASDDQHRLLTQHLPVQDDIASFSTSVAATHEPVVVRSMSPDLEMEQDTPIILPPTEALVTTTSSSKSTTPPPSDHHHVDIDDEDDLDRARARALHHHRTRSDRHGGKKKSTKKKKSHRHDHRRNQSDAY